MHDACLDSAVCEGSRTTLYDLEFVEVDLKGGY